MGRTVCAHPRGPDWTQTAFGPPAVCRLYRAKRSMRLAGSAKSRNTGVIDLSLPR